jgi:glyceraldehyde 3-phosphate dehydrogenase
MVKVGINGFGRIGRSVLRAALGRSNFQVVAINDLTDSKTLAHLLKYDSLLGTLSAKVEAGENQLVIEGMPIHVFSERDPESISWKSVGADIVIESTGLFTDKAKAEVHITNGGAKRVIISAPGKNDDITVVIHECCQREYENQILKLETQKRDLRVKVAVNRRQIQTHSNPLKFRVPA